MRDDFPLLDLMLADQETQPNIFKPGPYWRGNQRRIAKAIRTHGIANFRSNPAVGKGYADTLPSLPAELWVSQSGVEARLKCAIVRLPFFRGMFRDYEKRIHGSTRALTIIQSAYYDLAFRELPLDDLPETTHGKCERTVAIRGKEYATLYVDFLRRVHNFARHVDFRRARTILEIGGGFGAWPHIMVSLYPNIRKVAYIDIPPMLYVGTQYLRHFFGPAVIDYRRTRNMSKIAFAPNDEREVLCLCPWQIEALSIDADICWNSASFSEMTPEIVGNYAAHVSRNMRDGQLCLMMNKTGADPRTMAPDHVASAFKDYFQVSPITPAIEEKRHLAYYLGER